MSGTRDLGAGRGASGAPVQFLPALGEFNYERPSLAQRRYERCGWVVALDRGTVEHEIELHVGAAGALDENGLLRQIFTAILADLPPRPEPSCGHLSNLLAHAARHRPTVAPCADCSVRGGAAEVHEPGGLACPHSALVCGSCTFNAGHWSSTRQGTKTSECVVHQPCSVLTALVQPLSAHTRRAPTVTPLMAHNPRSAQVLPGTDQLHSSRAAQQQAAQSHQAQKVPHQDEPAIASPAKRWVPTPHHRITRPAATSLADDASAESTGHLAAPFTVTAVISRDIAAGGAGNTTARPCRSKSIDSWRGRMDDNDSVKEVRQRAFTR